MTISTNSKIEEIKEEILGSFTEYMNDLANDPDRFCEFLDDYFPENEVVFSLTDDIEFINIGSVQIGYTS